MKEVPRAAVREIGRTRKSKSVRFANVGAADLNLLKPLYALLQERQITRAAVSCGMSQPAMSRALERLRVAFDDELLTREARRFERTPRADRLLAEVEDLLPRLETALRGDRFEPKTSRHMFRLAVTEYASTVIVPKFMALLSRAAPRMQVELVLERRGLGSRRGGPGRSRARGLLEPTSPSLQTTPL